MKQVHCPPGFANSLLNGSNGIVLWTSNNVVTLLLVTGPKVGREWQFRADHLCDVSVFAHVNGFGTC